MRRLNQMCRGLSIVEPSPPINRTEINRQVTEKQIIDATRYSPQWLDIVEKYMNWPGFKEACWYFHAHVNEAFSQDKETIVARYSPISPQDFKNGAFDIAWFNEAYGVLGEKRGGVDPEASLSTIEMRPPI